MPLGLLPNIYFQQDKYGNRQKNIIIYKSHKPMSAWTFISFKNAAAPQEQVLKSWQIAKKRTREIQVMANFLATAVA